MTKIEIKILKDLGESIEELKEESEATREIMLELLRVVISRFGDEKICGCKN